MSYQKRDEGKLDWSILPWDQLEAVVRVFEFSARKYGRESFKESGDEAPTLIYRCIWAALFRHSVAALKTPTSVDEESGELHLAHACACVLMLIFWADLA